MEPSPAQLEEVVNIQNPNLETCQKLKNLSLIAQELGDTEVTLKVLSSF